VEGDSGAAACLKAFIVCKILDLHVFACHKSGKKKEHRGEKIYNKMCLHVYVKRAKKKNVIDYAYAMCASYFAIQ